MQQITINGIDYTITFLNGSIEVEHLDEATGLNTVYVFSELKITPRGIRTGIEQFQITPTGERIGKNSYERATSQTDYENFIASPIADLILKYVVNGIFRFLIQNTEKVYTADGTLITTQPVLPPE